MKSTFKAAPALIIFFYLLPFKNFAQLQPSKYEVGLSAGTLMYQGDLAPHVLGNYRTLKPAVAISVSRLMGNYFSIRGSLMHGKISSDETVFTPSKFRQFRNFKFSSPVTELSASLVFNPFGNSDVNYRKLTPYVFAGAGLARLKVKSDWSQVDTNFYNYKSSVARGLAIDTLQSGRRMLPVLPVGAGLRLTISDQFSLIGEMSFRLSSTDYIDGFYHAANPKSKDTFYGVLVGVMFRPGGYKCPPVRTSSKI